MTTQSITTARRIHRNALNSETQAEDYGRNIEAIRSLDGFADNEMFAHEMARLEELQNEFYEDADERRSQIATDHIDYL